VRVRGRDLPLRYRVQGPYLRKGAPQPPLFVLVVQGVKPAQGRQWRRRQPAFFLLNAVPRDGQWVLPLPVEEVLAWAWPRWEVEVAHREMKSDWGVGTVQWWHPRSRRQEVW
jgi:hypothetical protein